MQFSWGEEFSTDTVSVTLKGPTTVTGSYYGGTAYYGGAFYYGAQDLLDFPSFTNFSASGKAENVIITFSTYDVGKYQVDYVEIE